MGNDYSIFLSDLDIKDVNDGTSSGSKWIASKGNCKEVFSPVDGKKIASVIETDEDELVIIITMSSILSKWHSYYFQYIETKEVH